MEPMALGSIPSSPSSPKPNSNYLPSFLIGDNQLISPNPISSLERNKSFSFNVPPGDNTIFRQKAFTEDLPEPAPTLAPSYDLNVSTQGPPKQSLFDTIDSNNAVPSSAFSNITNNQILESSTITNDFSRGMNVSSTSMVRASSFSELDTTKESTDANVSSNLWVTVFGFSSNTTSLILTKFSTFGTIIDKKFPPQGNWIHLRYNSPLEVARALGFNGKMLSAGIMIGVMPYQQKLENKENKDALLYTSPIRARPLRHSFRSPQNFNTVVSPHSVPQKSTGFITKAVEYVFGW